MEVMCAGYLYVQLSNYYRWKINTVAEKKISKNEIANYLSLNQ